MLSVLILQLFFLRVGPKVADRTAMPATLSGFIIDVPNFVLLDALGQTTGRIHHAQSQVSEACCRKMSRIFHDMSRIVVNFFMTFYDALILQKTNIFCREILSQNVANFL